MKKLSKHLYFLVGIVFPIFIGLLHLFAHFKYLVTPSVQKALNQPILIFNEEQIMYNTWGVMSVMMGTAFITIGLLNIVILKQAKDKNHPPVFALIGMLFYLITVVYIGITFNAKPQLYGSIFGIICIMISFGLIFSNKNQTL